MSSGRRKYIESHWGVFVVKGAITLLAGVCLVLTSKTDTSYLTAIVSVLMLGMAALEIFNVLHRNRLELNWGFPLAVGVVEFVTAIILLCTISGAAASYESIVAVRIAILSIYMAYASVLSILIGIKSLRNYTDSLMWVISGIIGAILSLVTLADNGMSDLTHIKIFGLYIVVKGATDLYFGIHSKDELAELHAQRVAKRAASVKPAQKKTAKKGKK